MQERFATPAELEETPSLRGTTWDQDAWHYEMAPDVFVCPECFALIAVAPPRYSDERDTRLVHAGTHKTAFGF